MTPVPRQMPLMLDHRPALGRADLLVSAANAEVVRLLSGWRDWPRRHMALVGPSTSRANIPLAFSGLKFP